jgi:hypothetical protein
MTIANDEKRLRQKRARAARKAKMAELRARLSEIATSKNLDDKDVAAIREWAAKQDKRGVRA